jgi:hypothetical protein
MSDLISTANRVVLYPFQLTGRRKCPPPLESAMGTHKSWIFNASACRIAIPLTIHNTRCTKTIAAR